MLRPQKIHTRNLITKQNSFRSKIPPPPVTFLMVRPLHWTGYSHSKTPKFNKNYISLWTGLWSSRELGEGKAFPSLSLLLFSPNREPVHRLELYRRPDSPRSPWDVLRDVPQRRWARRNVCRSQAGCCCPVEQKHTQLDRRYICQKQAKLKLTLLCEF